MPRFRTTFLISAVCLLSTITFAADAKPTPTIRDFTASMKAMDGLFPAFWDAKSGHLYLQLSKFGEDFLFLTSLPYGLGSNDIGLDRGRPAGSRLVHFSKVGPKVLLVQPNLDYRSSSSNPAERLAVKQSFAESVLAGFKVEAEDTGAVVIDATDFFLADSFRCRRVN